jgi:heme ABC exporter ATP-binding subunit CcmA
VKPVRLRAHGVEKRFGRVVALRGLDFQIDPGESVSILGANGAGKTTLLRILAGLSRPTEGRFEASCESPGKPPVALTREALRGHVGYVGHATLLYGELSARENLIFAARLEGAPTSPERIDTLLRETGLLEVADRRAGRFSRGMAQRLSIARAIVHEPPILLLDEPFTGLDEVSAERLSRQLRALRSDGRSLIVVTHDPGRAVALCDRALVLHRGQIVAEATRETGAAGGGTAFTVDALRSTLHGYARRAAEDAA